MLVTARLQQAGQRYPDLGGSVSYTHLDVYKRQVGMNAGIIGMLIMLSRVFDGVSDVFAGNIIDKTHHRLGKARSWMLWTIIPVALVQILMFSIPNTDQIFQYAYFFVTYTLLNAVFYTLNNVAYATLSVFITPNKQERVQLGVFRFIFTCLAGLLVSSATMSMVNAFGGGMTGWRRAAIVYLSLIHI